MRPGYSKLLIHEKVMPEADAPWEATSFDILMMSFLSAKERTEKDWRELIESVPNLVVVSIWREQGGIESIIECQTVDPGHSGEDILRGQDTV